MSIVNGDVVYTPPSGYQFGTSLNDSFTYDLSDGTATVVGIQVTLAVVAGNQITGTVGHDVIIGGPTDETLTGLAGTDTFVFGPGGRHDTISDFHSGEDLIDVTPFGLDQSELQALLATGGDTITFEIDAVLTVTGIDVANLHVINAQNGFTFIY